MCTTFSLSWLWCNVIAVFCYVEPDWPETQTNLYMQHSEHKECNGKWNEIDSINICIPFLFHLKIWMAQLNHCRHCVKQKKGRLLCIKVNKKLAIDVHVYHLKNVQYFHGKINSSSKHRFSRGMEKKWATIECQQRKAQRRSLITFTQHERQRATQKNAVNSPNWKL